MKFLQRNKEQLRRRFLKEYVHALGERKSNSISMTRHRGQKYLCQFMYNLCGFIYNLSLSKITSYNTFTTLLLGLRLSALVEQICA